MAPPITTRPSFPLNHSIPSGSFHKPLTLLHHRRQTENHNHRKSTNLSTWTTALSDSMKLWAMPCRATQDRWVMVESSDKTWPTGEGNGKPLKYSCLENPMNSMKRQKDRTLNEFPRSVGVQYVTGDQWRNNSRKNEEMEPKQKQHPVVDVTGDGSKIQCYKEQYCIGIWNVRSMNQGKLEVGQSGDGKSECRHFRNQWTKSDWNGEFNAGDHYIYYCGQESLRRYGVAIIVNKRVQNAVLGCSLKNDRKISVHCQDKSFNILVI